MNGFTNQVSVALVIRMDDDDTARTDHFWPGGRDDKFFSVLTHPPHVNEFGFPRQALDFGIGDGRPFNRVVDVGSQIFDDVAFLEQFNKDGLRDAAVVGGVGEVFSVEIAGQPHPSCGVPHGLGEGFNRGLTEVQKFSSVVGFHLPLGVFFHGKFDVDAVSVNPPREKHFFAQQALAPGDHIDHRVLGNGSDMPGSGWVRRWGINDKELFSALGFEGITPVVKGLVGIMGFLNGFLQINGPAFFG